MAQRKYFSEEDDLMVLRDVIAQNPFEGSRVSVAEKIQASGTESRPALDLDARRVRERTLLILSKLEKADKEDMKASGVEHEFGEKEQLIYVILDHRDEAERKHKQQKEEKGDEETRSKELQKKAMETMSAPAEGREHGESGAKRRRTTNNRVFDCLADKTKQEQDLNKEEIELKTKQLELDTARFELEKEERIQKLESEK